MIISPINNGSHALQYVPKIVLSKESTDIFQRLKKINAGYFFRPDSVLLNKLKVVEPVELTKVLKCFFMEIVQEGRIEDPVKFLDRLATVIPLAKMQEALKDDVKDPLKDAKGMFEEAKLYLQMTSGSTSLSIRACISSVLDGIISVIESIITAFGIGDFFKPAESEIHTDFKAKKIMMQLSLFSLLTTMILPILGSVTGKINYCRNASGHCSSWCNLAIYQAKTNSASCEC